LYFCEQNCLVINLQARKLQLIEYLIQLQDEKEFSRIEASIIPQSKIRYDEFRPFKAEELIVRAQKSENDYKEGRLISQEKLLTESENW
jgi:hypothetical protein